MTLDSSVRDKNCDGGLLFWVSPETSDWSTKSSRSARFGFLHAANVEALLLSVPAPARVTAGGELFDVWLCHGLDSAPFRKGRQVERHSSRHAV